MPNEEGKWQAMVKVLDMKEKLKIRAIRIRIFTYSGPKTSGTCQLETCNDWNWGATGKTNHFCHFNDS